MKTWTQTSPLGTLAIASTPAGVTSLEWTAEPVSGSPDRSVAKALDSYFAGDHGALSELDVDFGPRGAFTVAVLEALREIPAGTTTTYGALAALAGRPSAARAVGQAVGSNPVPVIVPCHRVIASNGSLGGFSAGLDRKRALLDHEGVPALAGGWTSRRELALAV
ncbi:MAG TPA: MGMT family protein [Acidimicrobiales bacterium]|nr:MGMT family protein [Acidimicrobiales bacterium]